MLYGALRATGKGWVLQLAAISLDFTTVLSVWKYKER